MKAGKNTGSSIFSVVSSAVILILFLSHCGPLNAMLFRIYLAQASVICFAVLGTLIMYATGGLNLSSGGQIYVGMIVFSVCLNQLHFSFPAALLLLAVFSVALSLLHLLFSTVLGINTIIYTLALQVIFTGAGNLLLPYSSQAGGQSVTVLETASGGIPLWFAVWTCIMLFCSACLHFTSIGRSFTIARILPRFPGTDTIHRRVSSVSLLAASLLFSCSSVFLFSRMHGKSVQISADYSYDVLTALFLGGCSFRHMVRTAVAGSIAIVLLNAVLLFTGLSVPMESLIKAAVVFIGCYLSQKES